jgi:hypothetical protein
MGITPRDALAQHLDIVEIIGTGDSDMGYYLDQLSALGKVIEKGSRVGQVVAQHLAHSRTYLISAPMTEKINNRATTMPESMIVDENHAPPQPFGFVVLEEPIVYTDLRGKMQIVHTLSWGSSLNQKGQSGWLAMSFNDIWRQPDDISQRFAHDEVLRQKLGRWHGISAYWLLRGKQIGPELLHPTADEQAYVAKDGDNAYPVRNPIRTLVALWDLLAETVSVHTTEHCDRAITRRAARKNLPTDITVITLRRQSQAVKNPGSGTPLDKRIWVAGHRRRYWCGSGPDRHQEWRNISGHWKGPEEASVTNRPKVNVLVR